MISLFLNSLETAQSKNKDDGGEIPSEIRGRRTISSILNKMTSPQEIGKPLAALYLLRQSPFYYSNGFADLYLASAIKYRLEEEVEVNLDYDQKEGQFVSKQSQYHDYLNRPEYLESMNLHDFVIQYEKIRGILIFNFYR
jgi:hypothetical protein